MGHEDWDLFAIVRSCKAANDNTAETPPTPNTGFPQGTSTTMSCLATFTAENGPFSFPNLVQPKTSGFQELPQLLMTFNPTTTTTTTSTSGRGINPNSPPFSDFTAVSIGQHQQHHHHHSPVLSPATNYTSIGASISGSDRFHHQQQQQPPHVQQPQPPEQPQQQQKQHNQLQVQVPQTSTMVLPNTQSQTPRSRKRKSQQKKLVCHVTADNLSADLWAWRKYGQKPIKGSPYPRNYYRCSSCKGCAARKQVERSLSDPGIFVVTYTGEHKHAKPAHRNSLAGSTRNKPSTTRLPETRETAPARSHPEETQNSFKTNLLETQNAEPESVAAGDSCGGDDAVTVQELEDSSEEDDDVLIPNSTAAMSEAVFLGPSTAATFNGDAQDEKISPGFENGSDPNSGLFRIRGCSEPVSDDNRFSPG